MRGGGPAGPVGLRSGSGRGSGTPASVRAPSDDGMTGGGPNTPVRAPDEAGAPAGAPAPAPDAPSEAAYSPTDGLLNPTGPDGPSPSPPPD